MRRRALEGIVNVRSILVFMVVLQAGVAHARFGKSNSGGVVGERPRSSSSSSSSSNSNTHAAVPVDSGGGSSSGYDSGSTYYRPWSRGYYSGAFVPVFGYGYGYYATPGVIVTDDRPAALEPANLRVTANAEMGALLIRGATGITLGVNGTFEGERFGVVLNGQSIIVGADDGSDDTDAIHQFTGKLTFAFLTGRYGRLRAELGTDIIFAADAAFIGASLGVSGQVWLMDSLAFEAGAWGTVYPFWQLDGRAGLVYGIGPVGLKVGIRAQMLDDRGLVDGQIHRDFFVGPYAGIGVAF
ncbi:MAG: hypothetical protein ACO1OB_07165 [Archangium sp.]